MPVSSIVISRYVDTLSSIMYLLIYSNHTILFPWLSNHSLKIQGLMFAAIWRYEFNDACSMTEGFCFILHWTPLTKNCPPPLIDNQKLFDFGFCKELTKKLYDEESGMYKLTQLTGSPAYMVSCAYVIHWIEYMTLIVRHFLFWIYHQAPENFLGKPYGKPVDAFSFGVLLWEMLHCKLAVRRHCDESMVFGHILHDLVVKECLYSISIMTNHKGQNISFFNSFTVTSFLSTKNVWSRGITALQLINH